MSSTTRDILAKLSWHIPHPLKAAAVDASYLFEDVVPFFDAYLVAFDAVQSKYR
jgi:hypothetical protein